MNNFQFNTCAVTGCYFCLFSYKKYQTLTVYTCSVWWDKVHSLGGFFQGSVDTGFLKRWQCFPAFSWNPHKEVKSWKLSRKLQNLKHHQSRLMLRLLPCSKTGARNSQTTSTCVRFVDLKCRSLSEHQHKGDSLFNADDIYMLHKHKHKLSEWIYSVTCVSAARCARFRSRFFRF